MLEPFVGLVSSGLVVKQKALGKTAEEEIIIEVLQDLKSGDENND